MGWGVFLDPVLGKNSGSDFVSGEGLMFNMKHEKIWPKNLEKTGAKEYAKHTV